MSRKPVVELDSYSQESGAEIPFKTKQCAVLAYNSITRTVGFMVDDITVQTVLDKDLPPNTKFITVKYRKNESGDYEFIF